MKTNFTLQYAKTKTIFLNSYINDKCQSNTLKYLHLFVCNITVVQGLFSQAAVEFKIA